MTLAVEYLSQLKFVLVLFQIILLFLRIDYFICSWSRLLCETNTSPHKFVLIECGFQCKIAKAFKIQAIQSLLASTNIEEPIDRFGKLKIRFSGVVQRQIREATAITSLCLALFFFFDSFKFSCHPSLSRTGSISRTFLLPSDGYLSSFVDSHPTHRSSFHPEAKQSNLEPHFLQKNPNIC